MKRSVKKLFAALFAVCILTLSMPLASFASSFEDVPADAWYADAVNWCGEKGIMAGMGEGKFSPSTYVTRAQITVAMCKRGFANLEETSGINLFSDVLPGSWYYEAIQWCADKWIITGIGGGLFDPNSTLTREQLAVVIYNFTNNTSWRDPDDIDKTPKPFDVSQRGDLSVYSDASEISDWAEEAMSWAVGIGMMTGTSETTIAPKGLCSRAELAMIIYKYTQAYLVEFAAIEADNQPVPVQ
ncbi:MAG: S-layer homology domain-containing protein [Clostridia bacterium]|nr:S-layer homology domain-containing protein [Clostridia bacterium]